MLVLEVSCVSDLKTKAPRIILSYKEKGRDPRVFCLYVEKWRGSGSRSLELIRPEGEGGCVFFL